MESGSNMVVKELNQGEEVARKLLAHIDSGSFSIETCRSMTLEMKSSFEKSTLMVMSSAALGSDQQAACPNTAAAGGTESPSSLTKNPHSESSGRAFEVWQRKEISKKRKTLPKWNSQVKLGSGPGVQGPVDDGYNWRKYGQKEILGAKNPRGYYRCTHRYSQGCAAMKQVQRSDDDPLVFNVTYRETHTCQLKIQALPSQKQDKLLSFQTGLKVKTEGLGCHSEEPSASSLTFSFPSTPVDSIKAEKVTFSPSSTLDNSYAGGFPNAFISPTTSESNVYFPISPCRMSNYGGQSLQAAESDFTDSAATSASNFPFLDMDFMLDPVDLDRDFPFDSTFLPQNF